MVGLLDMAPVAEKVSIRGEGVEVRGLSLEDIRDLLAAFPNAASLFDGNMNAGKLLAVAPDLVAAGICLACGYKGSPDEIAAMKRYPAGDQVKLLNAVIKLTSPDGIGPFVELVSGVVGEFTNSNGQLTKDPDMSSRRPSRAAPVSATKRPK